MNLDREFDEKLSIVLHQCVSVYDSVVGQYDRFKSVATQREKDADLDSLYFVYENVYNKYRNHILEIDEYKVVLNEYKIKLGSGNVYAKIKKIANIHKRLKEIKSEFEFLIDNEIFNLSNLEKLRNNGYRKFEYSTPAYLINDNYNDAKESKRLQHTMDTKLNRIFETLNTNTTNTAPLTDDMLKRALEHNNQVLGDRLKQEILTQTTKAGKDESINNKFLQEYASYLSDSLESFSRKLNEFTKHGEERYRKNMDEFGDRIENLKSYVEEVYSEQVQPFLFELADKSNRQSSEFKNRIEGVLMTMYDQQSELNDEIKRAIKTFTDVTQQFESDNVKMETLKDKLDRLEGAVISLNILDTRNYEHFEQIKNEIIANIQVTGAEDFDAFEKKINQDLDEKFDQLVRTLNDGVAKSINQTLDRISNAGGLSVESLKSINDNLIKIQNVLGQLQKDTSDIKEDNTNLSFKLTDIEQNYSKIGAKRRRLE